MITPHGAQRLSSNGRHFEPRRGGLPPHNIDAEEAVLSALLLHPETYPRVRPLLEPEDFFREQNGWCYDACTGVAERGDEITITTIAHELERRGRLDAVGGLPFLVELANEYYFTPHGAEAAARIIKDKAFDRALIKAASEIARIAFTGTLDPHAALAESDHLLQNVRDQHRVVAGRAAPSLSFLSLPQLAALVPDRPEAVVEGLVFKGARTELSAKVKAGKTTLLAAMTRAVVTGEPFLDRPTRRTKVVILTEELVPTFKEAMGRAGLLESEDVHVLCRSDCRDLPWGAIAAPLIAKCDDVGAELVIVDTLSTWAGLSGDDENNAGAALEAMRPLEEIAAAGRAVVYSRHDRKSGGELGDSGRGSSAFAGAADVLLALRRADTKGHPNRRTLLGVGRFTGVPDHLVLELRNGAFVVLGDHAAVEQRAAHDALLEILPESGGPALSERELLDRLGGTVARSTLQRSLEHLLKDKRIVKTAGSAGKSGRAAGYTLSGVPTYRNDPGLFSQGHAYDLGVPHVVPTGTGAGHNELPTPQPIGGHADRDLSDAGL